MIKSNIRDKLIENGLKVTPQRIAVYEAVVELNNHPTAEEVIGFIKENHPNIAIGTVYKILETYVEIGLIIKVNTDKDFMRYDAIIDTHHHLYCSDDDKIVDYMDNELDKILADYFKQKNIPNFIIDDIKLQIIGKFKKKEKQ